MNPSTIPGSNNVGVAISSGEGRLGTKQRIRRRAASRRSTVTDTTVCSAGGAVHPPRPNSYTTRRTRDRRAQMEMIGLVFIVAIIVVGIVLYVSLSSRNNNNTGTTNAQTTQKSTSYLVALSQTEIPECGVQLSRVVQACVNDEVFCDNGDPCKTLNKTINLIANATLRAQGVKFNLSLEGSHNGVQIIAISACNSANKSVSLLGAPSQPIPLPSGQTVNMRLNLCK